MDIQESQLNMNPDESAAALAFATKLSEGLLGNVSGQPQELSQGPQNAPGSTEVPQQENMVSPDQNGSKLVELETKIDQMMEEYKTFMNEMKNELPEVKNGKNELSGKFEDFKDEIKSIINEKFDSLSKSIKDVLK